MAQHNAVLHDLESIRTMISANPLAAWINYRLEDMAADQVRASMLVEARHIAPNEHLHAAVVTALADITAGIGTAVNLPGKNPAFSTLEIKTNFLRTVREGRIFCTATPQHMGARTHVWDAEVIAESGKPLALFRCTQMILSPQ